MDRRSQVSDIYVKNRSICKGPADSLHKGKTLGTRLKLLTGSAIFINGGLYIMKQFGKILNFIQNDRWGVIRQKAARVLFDQSAKQQRSTQFIVTVQAA